MSETTGIKKLQVARRMVQLAVVVLILAIPAVARYNNYLLSRELDKLTQKWRGSVQGVTLGALDGFFRALPDGETQRAGRVARNRKQILVYTQFARGGPWSLELAGVSMTDPLAGAESIAASKRAPWTLWVGLFIPLAVAVLLGRVFCSWVCPMNLLLEMTDKLRRLLGFLELPPADLHFSRWIKYGLLGTGLVLAAVVSLPVLGAVYPPAVVSRELHEMVFAIFERAEQGNLGFRVGGLTLMSAFIAGIALFEITVSRRWWCRYICPGGALYSLLGRARVVRVKRNAPRCTDCGICDEVCPWALRPMSDLMGPECDNCGLCISHCADDALDYSVTGKRK